MLADIIFLVFFAVLVLNGKKSGFVKSVLGVFSVIICGGLTVIAYNYAGNFGIISALTDFLKSVLPEKLYFNLEQFGISGYVINAVIAVLIYICVKIVFKLAVGVIDIAVPSFINSAIGGILGGIKALAVTFTVLAVIYSVRHTCDVTGVTDVIEKSKIVRELYENNILLKLI